MYRGSGSANRCARVCGLDMARCGDGDGPRANVISRGSGNESARGYGRDRVLRGHGVRSMPCRSS